jgi:Family of unknown function (DUF5947)
MTAPPPPAMTSAGSLAFLRRLAARRPAVAPGERCEMCGIALDEPHQHVVNTEERSLLCTCRPCYLLFTARSAELKFRAVPDRYLAFGDFALGPAQWDELEIPVGLAFFFHNARMERTVAFYPGPAGATESELSLGAWDAVLAANPSLTTLEPDVEALLIRAPHRDQKGYICFLVPIDRCYELVGHLRRVWRGFDGGQEARQRIEAFFADLARRSRPAPAVSSPRAAVGGPPSGPGRGDIER